MFSISLDFCGDFDFSFNVDSDSTPISYKEGIDSFLVETTDYALIGSYMHIWFQPYLIDYPTVTGVEAAITVNFINTFESTEYYISLNMLPYFEEEPELSISLNSTDSAFNTTESEGDISDEQ